MARRAIWVEEPDQALANPETSYTGRPADRVLVPRPELAVEAPDQPTSWQVELLGPPACLVAVDPSGCFNLAQGAEDGDSGGRARCGTERWTAAVGLYLYMIAFAVLVACALMTRATISPAPRPA